MAKHRNSQPRSGEVGIGQGTTKDTQVADYGIPSPSAVAMSWDEWVATKAAAYNTYLAGFRHVMRGQNRLRAKFTKKEWEAKFQAFLEAPSK